MPGWGATLFCLTRAGREREVGPLPLLVTTVDRSEPTETGRGSSLYERFTCPTWAGNCCCWNRENLQ